MIVLDASAVLAFLAGEQGSEIVERQLAGGVIGAANWSEVLQKIRTRGADCDVAAAVLASYGVEVVAVTAEDALVAARLWHPKTPLSLGDRLGLALGERMGVSVLTADRAWGSEGRVVQIR